MTSFLGMPFTYLCCTYLSSSSNIHYMRHMTTAWARTKGTHTHIQVRMNIHTMTVYTRRSSLNPRGQNMKFDMWCVKLLRFAEHNDFSFYLKSNLNRSADGWNNPCQHTSGHKVWWCNQAKYLALIPHRLPLMIMLYAASLWQPV